MRRIDYRFSALIGYDEDLVDEETILKRFHARIEKSKSQSDDFVKLPTTRAHMTFGKNEGVSLKRRDEVEFPSWDLALLEAMRKR